MTGIDRIAKTFKTGKKIKIMTHVVGGYPSIETSESLICTMAGKGVDLVEVQLPFSDPIADGPVIVQANHSALQAGITTGMVLEMIERVRSKVTIPLLIMSYINPLYAYGLKEIVDRAVAIGVDGFIVPDCPLDEPELDLPGLCSKNNLAFVPLIAPTTTKERMKVITQQSISPFVYAVLRLGVTGRKTEMDKETKTYLNQIKEQTGRYVAAGFGIREKAQVEVLAGYADCGIVGSELLRRVNGALACNTDPVEAVSRFLDELVG